MASATMTLQSMFVRAFGQQQLAGPLLILLILAMMVLPLPPLCSTSSSPSTSPFR
jgi:flagellar biosynthesis protein FlhA